MAEKMIDDKTVVAGIVSVIQECLNNGKKKNNPGTWKEIFASNDFLDIQYSTVFEEELKKIIASLPGEEALSDIPAMFLMELLIAYGFENCTSSLSC